MALLPNLAQAQAIEAWVQHYSGPGNGDDGARAIAVDASGNVYVTGSSYGGDPLYGGSEKDYTTIKYSSAGVPLWTNSYDGAVNSSDWALALVLDANGNVYVAGSSVRIGNGFDYLTFKYSGDGTPLWTNRYNGPENSDDFAFAAALDASGNVLVTGRAGGSAGGCTTVKYSSAGALLWAKACSIGTPKALAVDADGNAFVVGTSGSGCTTVRYSSAGALLWARTSGIAWPNALALDLSANVVVTGCSDGVGSYWDYTTIKYSSAGVPLWTNRYNGPGNDNDEAKAVAVDSDGNVFVTGSSWGGGTLDDYATIKYSSAGVPLWTNRYNGPANHMDSASALALDASGNVYVTGSSASANTDPYKPAYATIAYSSAGEVLWTSRYKAQGTGVDSPGAVAVDGGGNVYVTGTSSDSGAMDSKTDFLTVKYVVRPIITRRPLSQTNAVGTIAAFTVEVAGSGPFSYQWRRQGTDLVDGGNISGARTTNLLIADVQPADAGGYSVVITNAYGSVTSVVAEMTVTIPPSPGRFSNFAYSPTMGFSFVFRDGTVGRPYRIQTSPSLAEGSWVDWQNFTYNGPIALSDMGAVEFTNRFYRAVSP